MLNRDRNFKWG